MQIYKIFIEKANKYMINLYDILQEARDDIFSFNRLRVLSFDERYDYCKNHLGQPIGTGSSRAVFQIDDQWVLKLAINKAGAAQNEAEIPDEYQKGLDIFAQVDEQRSDMHDFYFIVSERVIPLGDGVDHSEEENLRGYDEDYAKEKDCNADVMNCTRVEFDWEQLCHFILQSASQYSKQAMENIRMSNDSFEDPDSNNDYDCVYWTWDDFSDLLDEDETLNSINDYLTNTQFTGWGDWVREENVGFALRNGEPHIVFLDSGFNLDIAEKFYSWNSNGLGRWDDENEYFHLNDLVDKVHATNDSNKQLLYICLSFPDFLRDNYPHFVTDDVKENFSGESCDLDEMLDIIKYEYDYEVICDFYNFVKSTFDDEEESLKPILKEMAEYLAITSYAFPCDDDNDNYENQMIEIQNLIQDLVFRYNLNIDNNDNLPNVIVPTSNCDSYVKEFTDRGFKVDYEDIEGGSNFYIKLRISPSIKECIKHKFNTILEKLNKNYNPDKLLD